MNLTAPAALRLIRQLAAEGAILITRHAKQRMRQRKVDRQQMVEVLRRGQVCEGPARDVHGNWVCALRHRWAGDFIRVVCAIEYLETGERVLVITVIREG